MTEPPDAETPAELAEAERLYTEWEAEVAGALLSDDPIIVLSMVMQQHLPLPMEDDTVMCLCHASAELHGRGLTLFGGPVFHRRHVAALQLAALRAAGHMPSDGAS